MSNKRVNALKELASTMDVQKDVRINVDTSKSELKTSNQNTQKKPKSRAVSNIPWYPKSAILKKELKLLALHEDTTLTGLIDEGIELLLQKRGKNINDYL